MKKDWTDDYLNNFNNMSKEEILEEFVERFTFTSDDLSEDENKIIGTIRCFHQETSPDEVKNFLSKAIDQTREETIREVEEITEERIVRGKFLPDLADPNSYYSGLYNGYQEIRQSLKSLINK